MAFQTTTLLPCLNRCTMVRTVRGGARHSLVLSAIRYQVELLVLPVLWEHCGFIPTRPSAPLPKAPPFLLQCVACYTTREVPKEDIANDERLLNKLWCQLQAMRNDGVPPIAFQ